jgi:hypothetical protein
VRCDPLYDPVSVRSVLPPGAIVLETLDAISLSVSHMTDMTDSNNRHSELSMATYRLTYQYYS